MIVYASAQVLPGDPGRQVLGREATPAAVHTFNQKLGYYDPLPVRYWHWLENAVQGDFGASYTDGRPVTDDLVPALQKSGFLALFAFLLCVPHRHRGRGHRRTAARKAQRPRDHDHRALVRGDAGVRQCGAAADGLRRGQAVQLVPGDRRLAARRLAADAHRRALPARRRRRPGALRLHRPDRARRHDRGAVGRLHAHGDAQGHAPQPRPPAPRDPQRDPADDRGGGDADRLPLRRARGDREVLRLPGHRPAHPDRRADQELPDAPGLRARRRRSSTSARRCSATSSRLRSIRACASGKSS